MASGYQIPQEHRARIAGMFNDYTEAVIRSHEVQILVKEGHTTTDALGTAVLTVERLSKQITEFFHTMLTEAYEKGKAEGEGVGLRPGTRSIQDMLAEMD